MFHTYKILTFFSMIFILIANPGSSQTVKGKSENLALLQINNQLKKLFGENSYKANTITDVDSMVGKYKYFEPPLENPYGTLHNCFIFTTCIAGSGVNAISDPSDKLALQMVGILKNGTILWHSNPEIGDYSGSLFTTMDLNNNGKVEIITKWIHGSNNSSLWIYSWDGISGVRINAIEDSNFPYFSDINGDGTGWGFFDSQGDGIWEILNQTGKYEYYTWSWNGKGYGKWSNTPNFEGKTWLPRNNMDVKVKCYVTKENNNFIYNYTLINKPSSKQRINAFYVQVKTDSVNTEIPNTYWIMKKYYLFKLEGWEIDPYKNYGYIIRDDSLGGFIKISKALPIIGNYYVRADNVLPDLADMNDIKYTSEDSVDFINNSVVGSTIVLSNPPSPFVPSDFLDTLISYKEQSFSLGWIDNQGIANSLDSKLDNAKKKLAAGDSTAAFNILNAFINEVEAQKGKHLTSDAYALLKYNAEYLITKLK